MRFKKKKKKFISQFDIVTSQKHLLLIKVFWTLKQKKNKIINRCDDKKKKQDYTHIIITVT